MAALNLVTQASEPPPSGGLIGLRQFFLTILSAVPQLIEALVLHLQVKSAKRCLLRTTQVSDAKSINPRKMKANLQESLV